MTTELTTAEKRRATRKRLLEDFSFYCRKALVIRTKDAQIVPFILNRAQRKFLAQVLDQWQRTGKVRIVILKARQLGLSTAVEAFLYWWVSQHRATKGIIVTHEAAASTALFDMTKRYHENVPAFLKPSTSRSNGRELKFDKLDSGYIIATAGSDTVGRGETLQAVHLSEVGLWPKGKAADIMNGLLQAVPAVDDTFVFVESTARGMSGPFYKACKAAEDGSSGYELCFLPWFFDDKYRSQVDEAFTRTPEEDELAAEALRAYDDTLDDEQLMFRRQKIALDGLPLFKQEYPSNPEEAFLTSGAPVFNLENLHEALKVTPDIKHRMDYCPLDQEYKVNPQGRLLMYREIDPHMEYTIGADVCKGVNDGDYSVATVLDAHKRICGVWRGQSEPDFFAHILYHLGKMYNWARLAVEFNNHGILPNTMLFKGFVMGGDIVTYPNLYTREVYDKTTDEMKEELGFYTDVKTRPLIIDELRQAIREQTIQLNDRTTIEEMITFIADPKSGKIEHEVGCHDDCVFALAIANHIHEGTWGLIQATDDFYFEMI